MGYLEDRLARKNGVAPPLQTKKEKKAIPKKSAKKIEAEKKEREERGDNDTELQLFFKRAMKHMTGYCVETGLKTERKIYQYAIMSIAHILPKRLCPSVMYHPHNWIELAPDIHHKFDNISWEEREKWACWPLIREKLIYVWQDLDPSERRHFPESVIKYMEEKTPF